MRIIRLTRREDVPDFTAPRSTVWWSALLAQAYLSLREAAARRIARHAFRSGPFPSSLCEYWASISVSCRCEYHCCSAWSITLLRSWPGCDCTKPSTAPSSSGSSVTLTLTRAIRWIVALFVGCHVAYRSWKWSRSRDPGDGFDRRHKNEFGMPGLARQAGHRATELPNAVDDLGYVERAQSPRLLRRSFTRRS